MNILVTGGAGFIGSHLVEALLHRGHRVTALDNLSTGKRDNLPPQCQPVVGDIRDPASVGRCVSGQDVVFHLAAFTSVPGSVADPDLCYDINVNGTRNLVEQACHAGVGRFILASTSAVYPDCPDTPHSEATLPDPKSPYAESKLECERLLEESHRNRGLGYAALRFFNVYGPRQDPLSPYASVMPVFITASQQQEPLTIYGDGQQTRDFVYVSDVVRANLLAMEGRVCGTFNVGTSHAVSILCLAQTIIRLTGSTSGYTFAPPRLGDALASTADISRISSQLGWTPQWDLMAGLAETIQWFTPRRGLPAE